MKMNAKNLMVSIVAIAMALILVATVSAHTENLTGDLVVGGDVNGVAVKVNGLYMVSNPALIAGETATVQVYFTAAFDDSEVTVKVELEDNVAETAKFDVQAGNRYVKTLTLEVPTDFDDDEKTTELELEITIEGAEHETEFSYLSGKDFLLTVQKPSYTVDFKSINVYQPVTAGETFPVEIVLKNVGYNDLDEMYITVSVPALGIKKTVYADELVAIEGMTTYETSFDLDFDAIENIEDILGAFKITTTQDSDGDETNTFVGKIYLKMPYNVEAGVYDLVVEVSNEDMTMAKTVALTIDNDFSNPVVVSGNDLIIVNPTNAVKIYRVVPEVAEGLSVSLSETVVVVPAGSSATVTVTASADSDEASNFKVSVFSGNELVSVTTLKADVNGNSASNPMVILTIILAIVFIVLLVVLIVLIGKKPEKSEEFGESYY